MEIFPVISLIGGDDLAFALDIPGAEACYILRQADPFHCAAYLETDEWDFKVWSHKHLSLAQCLGKQREWQLKYSSPVP